MTVTHGAPVRPRCLSRPFLRPFHVAAVGFSRLALDPLHRFRISFAQRYLLSSLPMLQLYLKAPQHPMAVFGQLFPLLLLTPVKR